ncbi:hypothetical protein CARUB_v10006182mg, partial [Capsella rubella]
DVISDFNEYGYLREAAGLFREMLADETSPDESTLAAVLICNDQITRISKKKKQDSV